MKCLLSYFDNFHFLTPKHQFQSSNDTWKMRKNESCQINLKDTSFDSIFRVDSEPVIRLRPKVFFELESRRIPSKMTRIPVKTSFLDEENKRKKSNA